MNYLTLMTMIALALSTRDPREPDPNLCLTPIRPKEITVNFDQAFDQLMGWEGGGVLHEVEGDWGGATKWGISQRSYPMLDIPNLTEDDAKDLLWAKYWNTVRASQIAPELRWDVFDFGVNAGYRISARTLQKSINLCRRARGDRRHPLKVDGDVGSLTLEGAREEEPERLLRVFRAYRTKHYMKLAEEYRGQAKFIHGWLRRAEGGANG